MLGVTGWVAAGGCWGSQDAGRSRRVLGVMGWVAVGGCWGSQDAGRSRPVPGAGSQAQWGGAVGQQLCAGCGMAAGGGLVHTQWHGDAALYAQEGWVAARRAHNEARPHERAFGCSGGRLVLITSVNAAVALSEHAPGSIVVVECCVIMK